MGTGNDKLMAERSETPSRTEQSKHNFENESRQNQVNKMIYLHVKR